MAPSVTPRVPQEQSIRGDVILERLDKLGEYLEFLRDNQHLTYEEFRADQTTVLAVERALQLAIQCVLDIASHILAATSHKRPEDYSEAILDLAEIGVIPAAYAGKIVGMAKFRNVLVHEYVHISRRKVYENWQGHLDDFGRFSEHIVKYLEDLGVVGEENG
jgi:uncharacterized protein YutE (UPF0331/DUF86 family)